MHPRPRSAPRKALCGRMWCLCTMCDVASGKPKVASEKLEVKSEKWHSNGTAIRTPGVQGQPWAGPIQFGDGRMADQMVQVGYNAQHKVPWHWPVPAYLVTKRHRHGHISWCWRSAGGWTGSALMPTVAVVAGFLSLLFVGLTTGLLVYDLEKPERFLLHLAAAAVEKLADTRRCVAHWFYRCWWAVVAV